MRVLGVVNSMVRASGVEMASGSSKGGALAFTDVVNVNAVLTRGKLRHGHRNLHAIRDG